MNQTSKIEQLELNVYPKDFNVQSNKSCLGRIIRSIVIAGIVLLVAIFAPISNRSLILIEILVLIGGIIIADRYVRRLYPDWPNKKKFIGKMILEKNRIKVFIEENEEILELSNYAEIVIFFDHYTGYSINMRDIQRNGNALIYLKENNGSSVVIKFNINTEQEYQRFIDMTKNYKEELVYYKEYLPGEISHILKPDLSSRIIYK
jgi:hypothetical protein